MIYFFIVFVHPKGSLACINPLLRLAVPARFVLPDYYSGITCESFKSELAGLQHT